MVLGLGLGIGCGASRSGVEETPVREDPGVRATPPVVASEEPAAAGRSRPRFAAEPTIRVGLAWGDSAVEVSAEARWWVREAGNRRPIAVIDAGERWRVVRLPFERAVRIERPDGYLSQPHAGTLIAAPLGGGALTVGPARYPGTVEFELGPDGGLTTVNVVALETYLEGVVAKEMGRPGAAVFTALEAQAVAARTYAIKRLGSRESLGFDVYGTILDQAYVGIPEVADSLAVRAVRNTRGEALVWRGVLIDAYYHSTCGGTTARVEQVFDDPPAPYLTSVDDQRPDGDGYWCQPSRYFRWSAAFDRGELVATVARNLPALVPLPSDGPGELIDLVLEETTPEGRALALRVVTTTGNYVIVENAIRSLFAAPDGALLRSTLFLFRPLRQGGRIIGLTLTGGGWGHGVGMCQVGAMERSRAGWRHAEILAAYYNGATLTTLY